MKLKNSTDWPDYFLRRLVSWCAAELEMPVREIREAQFRNSRSAWGGAAYYWRGKITVCVGDAGHFPTVGHKHANGHQNDIADRVECLVWVTAHEAAHVAQKSTRTRGSHRGGGSEIATEWHAKPLLEKFRANREHLLLEWSNPPARQNVLAVDFTAKRADKALRDLERWQRKLKLAQTKVRKLRVRVRYYDKRKAACSCKGSL